MARCCTGRRVMNVAPCIARACSTAIDALPIPTVAFCSIVRTTALSLRTALNKNPKYDPTHSAVDRMRLIDYVEDVKVCGAAQTLGRTRPAPVSHWTRGVSWSVESAR
jgi:hypothetical protein